MPALVAAVERGIVEEGLQTGIVPPRINMPIQNGGVFRVMPGVLNDRGLMGLKAFYGSSTIATRYLVAVFDQVEGALLALIDGNYLTAARTGATTGVATAVMARTGAQRVGVIGSGMEARTNLQAVCAVREVKEVRIFSPRPHRRQKFAEWVQAELGINAEACKDPEAAVEGSDIVVVATNSHGASDPICFRGAWMEPGMHVNAIGSTMPYLREIDVATWARADRVVVDAPSQMVEESGDVVAAIAEGTYGEPTALSAVVTKNAVGRAADSEITLFKSAGNALQDVCAAFAVYEAAVAQGIGVDVGELLGRKVIE